ncbi:uncharacterized protein [Amphiura filiformis]|uniref:uncharacterized protein n=1 Tax=Amphiura filiformis TaxID=82378 RepID=UPI003B2181E6
MGFRSQLSEWVEIELVIWSCTISTSVTVHCPFVGTAHVSTEVLRLGAHQVQLQFYPKGKSSTKHEGKPCFYLFSPQIQPNSKFQIEYECSIEQDNVKYTTGKKSALLTCKTVKEHVVPAQQIARFGTSPTFCLEITSVSAVTDVYLKISRDMNTIRPATFQDGEGGEWKVKFVSGDRSGLTLALAPCASCHQTDMTVLHWKGAFLPKRSKQEPLTLNDDKVMCATTACQDSHVTEFRMETSLNTTQFITNQYLYNKRLLLRVEILKIQHGVIMPQPHDVMVNLGLRGAAKLVDKVQQLEEENARLMLELQELKSNSLLNNNQESVIDKTTQVNEEDFRRPSSTSSQPSNPEAGVSEAQLDHLAGNLGHNWKRLAIKLNFKLNEIEQIEEETSLVRERIFSMLYKWKRRTRRSSTVGKLIDALKSIDEDYDAYRFLLDQ